MNLLFRSGFVALALFAAGLSSPVYASDADFTLVNRTGYTLREIYLSPTKSNTWGRDRLGDEVLENNRSRLFRFGERGACTQDLKVVFDDDGSSVVWESFDLCSIVKITLRYNRRTGETTAVTE